MDTTFNILVIVLSSLLAIFLIICIAITVVVYKLVKAVRNVVAKGELLVDNAEEISESIKRNVGAAGFVKNLTQFMQIVNKVKKG